MKLVFFFWPEEADKTRRHSDKKSGPTGSSAETHRPRQQTSAAPPPPTGFQILAPKARARDMSRDDAMTQHAVYTPTGSQTLAAPSVLPLVARAKRCVSPESLKKEPGCSFSSSEPSEYQAALFGGTTPHVYALPPPPPLRLSFGWPPPPPTRPAVCEKSLFSTKRALPKVGRR